MLGEVARELAVAHVHVVGPLDENFGHVLGEEPARSGREPEVEDELVGGGEPCLEIDAGEDVESARAVPFVRARAASRRLEVGIDGGKVGERVAVAASLSRQLHQEAVG